MLLSKEIHIDDPKEYKVERILDHKGSKPDYEYFIK